jgi:hypothetical protein
MLVSSWVLMAPAIIAAVSSRSNSGLRPPSPSSAAVVWHLTKRRHPDGAQEIDRSASAASSCRSRRAASSSPFVYSRTGRTVTDSRVGENARVPAYTVSEDAVRHAKQLIDARQYVLRSRWQDVQPRAREQNAFLKTHSWEEYAAWHLGLTEGVAEETKARYAFVYGDFRRLHRMGLIACHYRAAEWRHKEIELAAHELLQYLDRQSASRRRGAARRGAS